MSVPKENIFRDEGASAKAMNRPQLLAMLEFCRKNKGKISKCIVSIQIQKRVQRTIFPQGLAYDFEKGFGTIHLNDSYLLISKIAPKGDLELNLVAATGIEPVTLGL